MIKCSVIKDLFTAYVSGLGSEDTCKLVDEHIETCAECRDKLTEIQNRVAAQLSENDVKTVNVFKTMKKKIFRRNVTVAIIAGLIAITLAFGGFWYVFNYEAPIQYEEGLIEIRKKYVELPPFATTPQREELDIISLKNYYSTYFVAERIIDVSGEKVKVIYFYLGESLAASWEEEVDAAVKQYHRLFGSNEDEQFDKMEVYYLVKRLDKISAMNDSNFYEQRKDGVLLWSGTLE